MKILTAILTFYFVLLSGAATLRLIKSHFSDCCEIAADNGCCQSDGIPDGCQKEKCVLNLNFSTGQFIVQQIQDVSIPDVFDDKKHEKLNYEKTFIPNYYNTFWHPPEITS
ncbi:MULTISPECIES: hypothetical protein [Flavobacterium]|uniref:hypothetical protein n=1 Tax=Flavobacterium TaxID=237 RepID=UPI001FCA6C34|nr:MULTISPECIES: hypothetical protein [Flavobacterium]UOK43838.1 hypothetical protein LZF87_06880 [Flavobacterium enshiense]